MIRYYLAAHEVHDTLPCYHDEWPDLAAVAADIHAKRAAGYPAAVAKGTLSQGDADTGIRIARAVAHLWQHVVARQDFPADPQTTLGVTWAESRDMLDAAAIRARQQAGRAGNDRQAIDYAHCVDALAWHHRPYGADRLPHIVVVHGLNQDHAAGRTPSKQRRAA